MARFRVCAFGRRGGKTRLCIEELVKECQTPNTPTLYLAKTRDSGRAIIWEELKTLLKNEGCVFKEQSLTVTFPNNSTIRILGVDKDADILRGAKYRLIICDEMAFWRNPQETWLNVLRPTLTDYRGKAIFVSTPYGFNYFYTLYSKHERDWESFHATSYDNTNLPDGEVDDAKRQIPEEVFQQEYLAHFLRHSGLIYKEFSPPVHVTISKPENTWHWYRSIDFGFNDPTCLLIAGYNPHTDSLYITREYYNNGTTIAEHAKQIKTLCKGYTFERSVGEHEAQIRHEYLSSDLPFELADKKEALVVISKLRKRFTDNRIYIDPSCKNLIRELNDYTWSDTKDLPASGQSDHALDALRYIEQALIKATEPRVAPTINERMSNYFTELALDEQENKGMREEQWDPYEEVDPEDEVEY